MTDFTTVITRMQENKNRILEAAEDHDKQADEDTYNAQRARQAAIDCRATAAQFQLAIDLLKEKMQ